MKRIVFLGSAPSAVLTMESVRKQNKDVEIVYFPSEQNLAYHRNLLTSYLRDEVKLKGVLIQPTEFYEKNNIRIMEGRQIVRINLHRRQIVLQEKEVVCFDKLVVTDVPDFKFPEIKGSKKVGVYAADRLDDMERIVNLVPFLDEIVIQSDDEIGEEIARVLAEKKKEVILIKPLTQAPQEPAEAPAPEPTAEDAAKAEDEPTEQAEQHLCVLYGVQIEEILGDNDAKAVRLNNGKVYASDMVIFTQTAPHLRLFYETSLEINDRICVDDRFQTSVDHVFAAGVVFESRIKSGEFERFSDEFQAQRLTQGLMGAAPVVGIDPAAEAVSTQDAAVE